MPRNAEEIFDVAVVGYGPAGVACANLLGPHVRVVVLERNAEIFPRQRGINVDDHAMRIIDEMGLLAPVSRNMHRGVIFTFIDADGREFGRLDHGPSLVNGQTTSNFFHQPWFEGDLRKGAERYENVVLHLNWEVTHVNADDPSLVELEVRQGDTGAVGRVKARYVLACDGGSSTVRKQLGIRLEGYNYNERYLSVQCKVKRPFYSTPHFRYNTNPDRPLGEMTAPGGHYRFEVLVKDHEVATIEQIENVWALLAERGVGPEDVEIQSHWLYTFHARQATTWRSGRVLFIGDAAHLMPPFAGQGISSGFRDAVNACWKVRAVLAGQATDRLLDTYESERRPHVQQITKTSIMLGRIFAVRDPRLAAIRAGMMRTLSRLPGFTSAFTRLATRPLPIGDGFRIDAKASWSGNLLPCFDVTAAGRPDLVSIDHTLGPSFAILAVEQDPEELLPEHVRAAWAPMEPRYLTVRTATRDVGQGDVGDPTGRVFDWFQQQRASVVIVRPDRYVYAAGAPTDASLAPLQGFLIQSASRSRVHTPDGGVDVVAKEAPMPESA